MFGWLLTVYKRLYDMFILWYFVFFFRYGGVTGCQFCALWSSLDQLQHDKTIDIYHLCKLYHQKRPGIIGAQVRSIFINNLLIFLWSFTLINILSQHQSNSFWLMLEIHFVQLTYQKCSKRLALCQLFLSHEVNIPFYQRTLIRESANRNKAKQDAI